MLKTGAFVYFAMNDWHVSQYCLHIFKATDDYRYLEIKTNVFNFKSYKVIKIGSSVMFLIN